MNCTYCGRELGENCLEGGYCSQNCRAAAEHEERLREREVMSVHVRMLDDGSHSVQINLRDITGIREMTRNYDTVEQAFRGIAQICSAVADSLGSESE